MPVEGFVYVPDVEDGPMRNAIIGSTIRNPNRKPPWIVVDHSLASTLVAKWPGRSWKAEVIEAAPEQPYSPTKYTRAVAVRVLGEESVARLFGPHGAAVCEVIKKARALELEQVQLLANVNNPLSREAYSRAWNRWLDQVDPASPHRGEDLGDALQIHATDTCSPTGHGFSVVCSVLADRARTLVGDAAIFVDDEGEVAFAPEWSLAQDALLGAAMAFGAPEFVSPEDRHLLTSAWVHVFGERF